MADSDMNLGLNITAQATGTDSITQAASAVHSVGDASDYSNQLLARLDSAVEELTSSIPSLNKALSDESAAHKNAGDSAKQHADTLKNMGGEMGNFASDFANHARSIGVAADAMGLQTGAAIARMSAFGQLLTGLGDAVPAIVGLAAATVGLFASFELAKDAIQSASALQDSMTRLGQVVKDQGGNWAVLSGQVKQFADAQVAMTTYSDTSVINSLERLVASGMSLSDAMTSTRIAEDLAAGSGRSLEEATNSLVEATHGRLMGLEAMGVLTKQQVKDGQTYDQVLQAIETHMGGAAAAATTTFNGSLSQLHSTFEKLLEDAGTPLLGLLAQIVKGFSEVVSSIDGQAQPALKALSDWAQQQIPGIVQWFQNLQQTVNFVGHEMRDIAGSGGADMLEQAFSDIGKASDDLVSTLTNGKHGWEGYRDIIRQVADAIRDLISMGNQLSGFLNDISGLGAAGDKLKNAAGNFWTWSWYGGNVPPSVAEAYPGANETSGVAPRYSGPGSSAAPPPAAPGTRTSYNPMLGGPGTKKASSEPPYDAGPDVVANYHDQSDALQQLNEQLSQLPKNLQGYNEQLAILAPLIAADTQKQTELGSELDNARNRLTVATDDYNAYKDSLQGVTKLTADQKEQLKQYQDTQKEAQQQVDALSTSYDKNRTELQGLTKDQLAAQDAIKKLATDWDTFYSESNAKLAEDLATFKMTESEKSDYYAKMWQQMAVTDGTSLSERENAYRNYISAVEEMAKQEYQFEINAQNSLAQHMSTFADDIIVENKSMASALKDVYDDILKYFLDMLAKMLAQAIADMPIFQAILSLFGGGGVGTNWGSTENQIGATGGMGGWGSAAVGGAGTSLASLASSPSIARGMASAMSSSGGGGSGASPMSSGFGGSGPGTYGGGGLGSYGNPSASGGASGGGFTGAGYNYGPGGGGSGILGLGGLLGRGGILGGLGMAGLGGMALGDIAFGGKGYSALGGALGGLGMAAAGGLAGAAFFGGFGPALLAMMSSPIGWGLIAGAALLGAFGGSLFGDHFSQSDEPDIYNSAYGPALADLQGSTAGKPMNAGGKQYVMDSQTSQATGGQGWNVMMEKFVQQFRGNLQWLPPDLRDAFPQIEALWGGATDKPDFNPDGKNGYLDVGSGKRALWSDFWAQVTTNGQAISQLMQSMSPTEMYVASVNGGLKNIGTTTSGPSGGSTGNPFSMSMGGGSGGSNAIASGGPGRAGGSISERLGQSLQLNFNINRSGTLMSDENLRRSIQDAVAQGLAGVAIQDLNTR